MTINIVQLPPTLGRALFIRKLTAADLDDPDRRFILAAWDRVQAQRHGTPGPSDETLNRLWRAIPDDPD